MLEKTINNSPGRLALPSVSSGLEAGSIFSLETISVAGILISIMANIFVTVKPPCCLRFLHGHPTTVSSQIENTFRAIQSQYC